MWSRLRINWRLREPWTLRQVNGTSGFTGAALQRCLASPHGGPVPAGQHRQPPVGKGQAAVALGVDSHHQAQLP